MEPLEFQWGKAGVRSKTPGVQFYNSFVFDGTNYALYDCVYMWKEDIPQPYIGKLVKIWNRGEKFKRVKVQWFFRPNEISSYLNDEKVLENELFFASGKGVGVDNINPLEAIAGKCNVVCISKDSRNPQPSNEQICKADYVFYRIFDVDTFSISSIWAENVGKLEVKFIFNRTHEIANNLSLPHDEVDVRNDVGGKLNRNHSTTDSTKDQGSKFEEKFASSISMVAKVGDLVKGFEVKQLAKALNIELGDNESEEKRYVRLNKEVGEDELEDISPNSIEGRAKLGSSKDYLKLAKRPHLDSESNPIKRVKVDQNSMDGITKFGSSKDSSVLAKSPHLDSHLDYESNPMNRGKVDENSMVGRTKIGSSKDSLVLGKHPQLDSKSNHMKSVKVDEVDELGIRGKDTYQNYMEGRENIGSLKDSSMRAKRPHLDSESNPTKSGKVDQGNEFGNTMKFVGDSESYARSDSSNNLKLSSIEKPKKFVVSRRPNAEKNRWMILPFEDRMLTAQKQGTLILLQNLDPEYTSGEVEDIIWHAFNENCSAKMVQHTAFSSPFCGLAFIILRSKEVADKVLKRLYEDCLMLPNGRPLVGSPARLPKMSENRANFVGHLSIDTIKHKMQKEMKEAVSTSHYSQPNTIEFEMAMEWFLIQARSTMSWKKLYKKQADEIKELISIFKSKQKAK